MKVFSLFVLLLISPLLLSKEVVMSDEVVIQLYDSSGTVGMCSIVNGLKAYAHDERKVEFDKFIDNFIKHYFSSDDKEWQSNCRKHIGLLYMINEGYKLNLDI